MRDPRATGDRFGEAAEAYDGSPVHARGEDLDLLPSHVPGPRYGQVVDVSAGTGHAALRLAGEARRVLAVDLARGMLGEARGRTPFQGGASLEPVQADAVALPLQTGVADVVLNRIAAHHYRDLQAAVAEMARVLAPDGVLLVVDNVEPEDPDVAAFLHDLEVRRDPTHVRSRSPEEWKQALGAAGLEAEEVHRFRTRLHVGAWAGRSGDDGEDADALAARLAEAPEAVARALEVQRDPPPSPSRSGSGGPRRGEGRPGAAAETRGSGTVASQGPWSRQTMGELPARDRAAGGGAPPGPGSGPETRIAAGRPPRTSNTFSVGPLPVDGHPPASRQHETSVAVHSTLTWAEVIPPARSQAGGEADIESMEVLFLPSHRAHRSGVAVHAYTVFSWGEEGVVGCGDVFPRRPNMGSGSPTPLWRRSRVRDPTP